MHLSHITALLFFLYTAAAIPIHGNTGVYHRRNLVPQLSVRGALEGGAALGAAREAHEMERRWGEAAAEAGIHSSPQANKEFWGRVAKLREQMALMDKARAEAYEKDQAEKARKDAEREEAEAAKPRDPKTEKFWEGVKKVQDERARMDEVQRKEYEKEKARKARKDAEEKARRKAEPRDPKMEKFWEGVKKVQDERARMDEAQRKEYEEKEAQKKAKVAAARTQEHGPTH